MRRLVLALAALFAFATAAAAGDSADREIIGFSADGRYFAFEEYGVQDGSGFPYSSIYLIYTTSDSWVAGTPFRVRLDDENATLEAARAQARAAAADALASHAVTEPGRVLLSNPLTEITDPHVAEFITLLFLPAFGDANRLEITEYPLDVKNCPIDFGQTVGFDLVLTDVTGATRTLHHDDRIPASRACPIGYGVSEVIAFDGAPSGEVVLIVLLNVFQIGFEGPDRRFMAIATSVPHPF